MAFTFDEIVARVPECTKLASESGDLLFFPSDSYYRPENGIDFHIRHCPALLQKPKLPVPDFAQGSKKKDPFAPPFVDKLVVGELQGLNGETPKYLALLNKYSVVANHFLVVTKQYESQSSPPNPNDLLVSYLLLLAARRVGTDLFAFYNCGDRSGASQHHKHVQFLSPDTGGAPGEPPIEKLAQSQRVNDETQPFTLDTLPYAHHVYRLPATSLSDSPEALSNTLAHAFISVLDLAIDTMRHSRGLPAGPPSFNVLLTLRHLHIIPRSKETHKLKETGDELSINALGFAGMLLVKSEKELEAVTAEGIGVILTSVGLEKTDDTFQIGAANTAEV